MVILSGAIMGLLKRARVPERPAALIGIVTIALYTLFVGANPAVMRAAVMSLLLVISGVIRRKTYVPASLAFVAIIMSMINPTALWDISFQLSFFATLGLMLYVEPLTTRFDRLLVWLFPRSLASSASGFLAEPLIVTIAAQITTLPLIVLYFSRLSLVSLPINLLIIPVQAPLLIIGILATLAAFVAPPLAQLLYWYDLLLLSWTTSIVRLMAQLPFADVEFHIDPRFVTFYFFLLIGVALMQAAQPAWARHLGNFVRQRAVISATAFAGVGTILLIGAIVFSRPDHQFHLWLLDVGHSNAVLMQTPGGAQILVDGGRFPSRLLTAIGDHIPFNDQQIDVLVLSQPDENEYGALPAVLDRYDIGVMLINGQDNLSPSFEALQERLMNENVVVAQAGHTIQFDDGVTIEVLHPQSKPELGDSLDDFTLVLRVRYDTVSFLLTSDVSAAGQRILLETGQLPLTSALQLPQHGGTRSLDDTFLQAAQPQVALVQADAANQRGDPNPDTLRSLEDVPLYRTDEQGVIHLWTDGQALWAQPET
jgi:competence protein ComEC